MADKEPNFQMTFAFIDRQIDNNIIQQRMLDGYINATAICKASKKNFADYRRLKNTNEFLDELSAEMEIPITALIQTIKGGVPELQGTWVHPYVATNLAQWASAKTAVKVSIWVTEWINGDISLQCHIIYKDTCLMKGKYLKINISLFSMKLCLVLLHLLNNWAIHYLII